MTNVITGIAGFLFASKWQIDWSNFGFFVASLYLVIASACVLNNVIDRGLDQKMSRTKSRALPTGMVSRQAAIIFGSILGAAGFGMLVLTNWLTFLVIAAGFIAYVVIYGAAKRKTVHSTLIGTIPGAASLVAGYTAVINQFDSTALVLFLIMLSWQMVHFYAIGIYRLKDYNKAKVPIYPVKKGVALTKRYMLFYLLILLVANILLAAVGSAGFIYLITASILGLVWLNMDLAGFKTKNDTAWARDMFKFSLTVIVFLSILIALGSVLP